jgi:hypothetical protein
VEAATCTRNAQRRETLLPLQRAATAGWQKETNHILPIIGAAKHAKEELQRRKAQRAPKITMGRVFSSNRTTPGVSFAAGLRGSAEQQQQPEENQVPVTSLPTAGIKHIPAPTLQQETGQSVQAPNVNSQPLDSMLRVVTVVQQIMTEFNGAVSERDKIMAITKIVLNLMQQNGH